MLQFSQPINHFSSRRPRERKKPFTGLQCHCAAVFSAAAQWEGFGKGGGERGGRRRQVQQYFIEQVTGHFKLNSQ